MQCFFSVWWSLSLTAEWFARNLVWGGEITLDFCSPLLSAPETNWDLSFVLNFFFLFTEAVYFSTRFYSGIFSDVVLS